MYRRCILYQSGRKNMSAKREKKREDIRKLHKERNVEELLLKKFNFFEDVSKRN